MSQPLGVLEPVDTVPTRELFTLFGVSWLATPYAWLSIPNFLAAGVLLAAVSHWGDPLGAVLWAGVIAGTLLFVVNIVHTLGHIASGRFAGAVMDANLVTATRHINRYYGPQDHYPPRVHLMRAAGGPVMNLLAGGLFLLLAGLLGGALVRSFGVYNLVAGLVALVPLRSVDGDEIWRELRRMRGR